MGARTFPDGYGTPPAQLTAAQIAAKHTRLNAEFLRRVLAMMDACPSSLGIGGGARSSALQEQLFRSRYTPYTVPPGIRWNGAYWRKNEGVASAAPPGSSYHEDDIPGGALAVDMIGDLKWMKAACGLFGLREFSEVNSEPWHVQPVEVPAARSRWDGTPIPVWGQQPPATPEPEKDVDMILVKVNRGGGAWTGLSYTGAHLAHVTTPAAWSIPVDGRATVVEVNDGQLVDDLIRSAQTTNACPPEWVNTPRGAAWTAQRG